MTGMEEENKSKIRVLNLVKKSTSAEAAEGGGVGVGGKEVCICSPTTHPGSFKCRLHRAPPQSNPKKPKATQGIGLSRFFNDVAQGNN